jgi:uncharacterized membrane protein
MRSALIAALSALVLAAPMGAKEAAATEKAPDVKGIFLLTDYPAVSVRPGATTNLNLRLQNHALPPEMMRLSVSGIPSGWTARLIGGGQPIAAAMAPTNGQVSMELRLDVPKDAQGTHTLTLEGKGPTTTVTLPLNVTLAEDMPAKMTLTPQLPELRGTSRSSFEFQLGIKNDSGRQLVVSLAAQAPRNFDTSFTEVFGTQEVTAIPIEAGQTKDVKLRVRPPTTASAGRYPVTVRVGAEDATATAEVALEITGQPRLEIAGRGGVVSGRATAGSETSIPIIITNTGTAPAEDVELSGSGPSGWKVLFEPKVIDRIPPNENREVQALITPPENAIAGDYVANLRASSRGETASQTYRVTVTTSTLWGVAGVGIIGLALVIMVGAVAWFGRR